MEIERINVIIKSGCIIIVCFCNMQFDSGLVCDVLYLLEN